MCLIKDDNKDRNKWKLGIVEEHIVGRDGIVTAVKLRAGKELSGESCAVVVSIGVVLWQVYRGRKPTTES